MSPATTVKRSATRTASANVTNDVVLALIQQNQTLIDAVVRLAAMNNTPAMAVQYPEPGYIPAIPDEVDDARFAHRAGLINDSELESVLRGAGFPSTSVDLA